MPAQKETLRILAVADVISPQLYTPDVVKWLSPVDLLISCGDLPPGYLDFLVSTLDVPMFHVIGNHCYLDHDPSTKQCASTNYLGLRNLNGRLTEYHGVLLGGVEGSPLYNGGPHQYTEQAVDLNLLRMMPGLAFNKVRTGRYLDVMVTHAPPRGIHDNDDMAHRGWQALIPFIERFHPSLLLHGHTHRYNPMLPLKTYYGPTLIVNAFGHALIELVRDDPQSAWKVEDVPLTVDGGK